MEAKREWPTTLRDPKHFYKMYFNEIQALSHNIVCGCCSTLDHKLSKFVRVPAHLQLLQPLSVNRNLVPFPFESGIRELAQTRALLESLTVEDLQKAAKQELAHESISNPPVKELLKLMTSGAR